MSTKAPYKAYLWGSLMGETSYGGQLVGGTVWRLEAYWGLCVAIGYCPHMGGPNPPHENLTPNMYKIIPWGNGFKPLSNLTNCKPAGY